MKKHASILVLLFLISINLCSGQTKAKKTYTDEELEKIEADYEIQKKEDKAARKELEDTTLTDLTLEDIDGNTYTLERLKGKVVVMNFWFIYCKPCVAEIPDLNELKAKFKGKEVVFLAVALDSKTALQEFLKTHDFDFTIIPKGRDLADRLEIPHYPYNVILDKTGKLHYISDVLSLNMMNRLKRKINGLLKD